MKAKLNYTNRVTINLNQIDLVIDNTKGEEPLVEMDFDPTNLAIDLDDKVYLEATFSGFYQSFDFGKVGKITPPADNRLIQIPKDFVDASSFYVKVIDETSGEGRISALSKKITPEIINKGTEKERAKRSFLKVKQEDLGETPWKIITEGSTVLVLNSRFHNPKNLLKNNPYFRNILIPAAVKEILLRIIYEAEDFSCEGDEWFVSWNVFISENLKMPLPEEDDDILMRLEFVDEVMDVFCKRLVAAERISQAL